MDESILTSEENIELLKQKHAQIPTILEENGIDCWMIFVRETSVTPDSIMQLVVGNDVVLTSAFIFAIKDGKFQKFALVGNFDADSEKKKQIWDKVIPYQKDFTDNLLGLLSEINPKKIALNYSINDYIADGLTHGMFLYLTQLIPDYVDRFVSAQDIIKALRGCKSPLEINHIEIACKHTEEINQKLTNSLKIGDDELIIQQKVQNWISERKLGYAWQQSQNPAIDAGPDKDFGHVGPLSGHKTQAGHTLHNDFGVKYHGYCSDLQRMWFFGKKEDLPEELAHAMKTIVTAIQLAADAIQPGVEGYKIDLIAREYVEKQGYEEFMHGLGHQVGIAAHDGGTLLGPRWERYGEKVHGKIRENEVYTLEPSLKTKNYGMVSMEEMIIVISSGAKFIVPPKNNFIFIE